MNEPRTESSARAAERDTLLLELLYEQRVRDQANASWDDENMFSFATAYARQREEGLREALAELVATYEHNDSQDWLTVEGKSQWAARRIAAWEAARRALSPSPIEKGTT